MDQISLPRLVDFSCQVNSTSSVKDPGNVNTSCLLNLTVNFYFPQVYNFYFHLYRSS